MGHWQSFDAKVSSLLFYRLECECILCHGHIGSDRVANGQVPYHSLSHSVRVSMYFPDEPYPLYPTPTNPNLGTAYPTFEFDSSIRRPLSISHPILSLHVPFAWLRCLILPNESSPTVSLCPIPMTPSASSWPRVVLLLCLAPCLCPSHLDPSIGANPTKVGGGFYYNFELH